MAAEYCRKSGQIPAFGDWDNANEMPITQYFECARQAGFLRCSCSGECGGSYVNNAASWGGDADLYDVRFEKSLPRQVHAVPPQPKKCRHSNEKKKKKKKKKVKVRELMDQPRNPPLQSSKPGNLVPNKSSITVKPVDEDLYKIPPELLENSKRKKMLGFFSKCMVPPCAA